MLYASTVHAWCVFGINSLHFPSVVSVIVLRVANQGGSVLGSSSHVCSINKDLSLCQC